MTPWPPRITFPAKPPWQLLISINSATCLTPTMVEVGSQNIPPFALKARYLLQPPSPGCFLSCSLPNQNLIWFVEPRSHAYTLVAKESRKESKFLAFGDMGFRIRGNPTNTGKLIKDTGDHKAWQMFPILYVVFLNTNWIIFWISSAWHTIGTQLMRKEKKKKEGRDYTITCCLTKTGGVKTLFASQDS